MPTIGTTYRALSTGQEFELEMITEKDRGKKLAQPIYAFRYTNRDNQTFTCYLKDIERSIDFEVWVKI